MLACEAVGEGFLQNAGAFPDYCLNSYCVWYRDLRSLMLVLEDPIRAHRDCMFGSVLNARSTLITMMRSCSSSLCHRRNRAYEVAIADNLTTICYPTFGIGAITRKQELSMFLRYLSLSYF